MNFDRHLLNRGAFRGNGSLGTVLAVWAHPDDESFVAGGLLAAASDAGSRIVCLTATRGEYGTADPGRWSAGRLARTRVRELAAAHAVLGIDEQRWLPFEDGACNTISPGLGMALVARVIADVEPDTIVTFGPDGLTGHTDHQAVSRWTSHAWAAKGSRARLLWAAIRLDLTGDLLDRKFSAIRAHATQSASLVHRLGEERFRRWWATESYIDVGSTTAIAPDRPSLLVRAKSSHRVDVQRDRRSLLLPGGTRCSHRS